MDKGTLYLCATPIGNLDDISIRALNTLKEADLIACEDTRHSLGLLNHFGISKPLTSYHEHNKFEKGESLIQKLNDGVNIALVTDAGTPAISDPGEELVKKCIENGIKVVPVPGAAALINALIVSGRDTRRFAFEGFLPVNATARRAILEQIRDYPETIIFYEAPHKLVRTLADMLETLGDRGVSIVRELTKIHETVMHTTLGAALRHYAENKPKGEFVLVVDGKSEESAEAERRAEFENLSVREHVDLLIGRGMDKKEAIKQAAKQRGVAKREVYNEYTGGDRDES